MDKKTKGTGAWVYLLLGIFFSVLALPIGGLYLLLKGGEQDRVRKFLALIAGTVIGFFILLLIGIGAQ